MARLLSPGDVVLYRDRDAHLRNALVLRVYNGNGVGPLADLVFVRPPENPALCPTTVRRSLVRPEDAPAVDGTFYVPAGVAV